ncbi:unnamed protein product [Sphagnum troendelagicum]|uniref:Uncharacterized protein n=1 Tax=Sphagnum troendelagicum TaxID=128251 RepID=A0ABP0UIM8_9BRYO
MLIHNGDMIAIILHGFVPPGEASKTSFATMERSSALALGSPRWCSLATGSVAVTSPSTGGYPKPSKPELCLFDRTLNLPFSHLVRSGRLSVARYRHSGKNARNQENWSPENLERCADIWAIEFVQANLRSHLASWLRELDSLFPEEFPFGTFRVERSCFSAMAVTENYPSTPHTDRDMSNSVIAWFLQEPNRRSHSRRRRPIRVCHPPDVFPTSTGDRDNVPVCMATALHHAYSRSKAPIRCRPLPSEGDPGSLRRSTVGSLSHKRSSQRIDANEKLHSQARKAKDWSPRRGLARHLLRQHPPDLRRNLQPMSTSSNQLPRCSIDILVRRNLGSLFICSPLSSFAFGPSPATPLSIVTPRRPEKTGTSLLLAPAAAGVALTNLSLLLPLIAVHSSVSLPVSPLHRRIVF